jgi:predicted RNase H-like HicB family nuclease
VKDIEYYMKLNYKIEIIKDEEEDGYVLKYPELKGCITCADTIEEGMKLLKDAQRNWLEASLENGGGIPEPLEEENFSGQFKLRIPKSLHKELMEKSKEEGISMNQYCLYLLSKGMGIQSEN